MKPSILLFLFFQLTASFLFAQNCLPQGITFTRQSQIDSFPILYPSCSIIEGNVEINGKDHAIYNLAGLSNIKGIKRSLNIINCDSLTNLQGLEQLQFIRLYLIIQNNFKLNSIAHLNSLDSIGVYLEIIGNGHLENLIGLDKIKSLRLDNKIINNHSLKNLQGLNNLNEIDGELVISNDSLINLLGLGSLKKITGDLKIISNSRLTSLAGLDSLKIIMRDLNITGNDKLINLVGLDSLVSVGRELSILSNSALISLQGFSNLNEIGLTLNIQNNHKLSDCAIYSICQYLLNGGSSNILSNLNGCNSTDEIVVKCLTATQTPNIDFVITIYPNPTFDFLEINSTIVDPISYSIFDPAGKLLKQWSTASSTLDVSEFSPGMYILNIRFPNQQVNQRIVKL